MRNMIRYFIKYPLMGNGLILMIALFGLMALFNTKTNFFPDIPPHYIRVVAAWPGASPKEVEEGIITIIEDNLKGISGVKEITSTASENAAMISVEVESKADINEVLIDVENEIDKINTFPQDMESFSSYIVDRLDPAIDIILFGDASLKEVKRASREFERMLLAKEGISKVTLNGFPAEEIEISLTEEKMQAYDITFDQVMQAVRSSNVRITGGTIKGAREEMLIRANNKGYYAAELGPIVLKKTPSGGVVRLQDVAEIKGQWEDTPNRNFFNGSEAVWVRVETGKSEDLLTAAQLAKETIAEFNKGSSSIKADVIIDRSRIVKERIEILSSNGIMGIILVLLFLGFFLHFRMAFWVSMVIPVALLGVFVIGPLYGFSINVMSLLGLILVLGLLVDHGIVIAENIYTRFEDGLEPVDAAVEGTMEVIPSVIGSVLTTMVIFAAFFFLEGPLGDRAKDIGFVVIGALGFSLIEAMFILPAHIAHSKALRHKKSEKHSLFVWFDDRMEWVRTQFYKPLLAFCMKHFYIGIAVPIAVLIITFGAMSARIIKFTFFPSIEFNYVNAELEMPAGTAVDITDSILIELEKTVWEVHEELKQQHGDSSFVKGVLRYIRATHAGALMVTLVPGEERPFTSKEFAAMLRKKAKKVPTAEKLTFGGAKFFGHPISVALQGPNFEELQRAKDDMKQAFREYPELKDIIDTDPTGLREVTLSLKPHAYSLGLTTQMVMGQVRQGFFGGRAQRIQRGVDEIDINVRYKEEERQSLKELRQMRIRTTSGGSYPLGEIAEFSVSRGVMQIGHRDGRSEIMVKSDLENADDASSMTNRIRREVIPVMQQKYPDVTFNMEGESKASKETMDSARVVVPLVLFLMFMIVAYTFRSFLQGIIVFMLIPVSLTGVFWGHWFTSLVAPNNYAVSLLSIFGIIALLGIIVNDSLVLISTMNRLLKDGKEFEEALLEAGVSRFRPVVLTSLTTVAGLAPLIFETSFHAQFLSPMAISVGYGLLYATLLTLLMLPSLLVAANRLKQFLHWVWYNKSGIPAREFEPAVIEDRHVGVEE